MTDRNYLNSLRIPTTSEPLRILMSACLTGILCGYDGSAYGTYSSVFKILDSDKIQLVKFCPEDYSFGTPREMCDIHGGHGLDVLEGKARVLTESGIDWTEGMIKASEKMLEIALSQNVELAIMMDVSAACGSQVIYNGNRFAEHKVHQIGAGVCGAQLMRNGIKVISQRDFASLEIVNSKLDPDYIINKDALDHHENAWYIDYFKIA
jgi:uncharacterized protein YbbK (DUF523 family)